jgi:hypothetical protein
MKNAQDVGQKNSNKGNTWRPRYRSDYNIKMYLLILSVLELGLMAAFCDHSDYLLSTIKAQSLLTDELVLLGPFTMGYR